MQADNKQLFETAPLLILILSPELHVITATDAYLAATLKKREEIVGRLVYDVFPDNPDDPNPQGVARLKATFNRVLTNKTPDAMGELKYDIPRGDGTFETRYWSTLNTPVLDAEGNILHIINHVMDITDYAVLRERDKERERVTDQLMEKAANLEGEIYQRMKQLQSANEKMSQANEELRATQEELQAQQEQLQAAHEELQAQQEELTMMNNELVANNDILEKARMALLLKAEELERSSSFKTDFLSNMSHELRTPLNSMLILSKLLSNNAQKNLTDKQVEHATIINKAGNDLLKLIDDILDLSKIEAGKIDMVMEHTAISEIANGLSDIFTSIADQKGITFKTVTDEDVPEHMNTDKFRLDQILKNLLSNAFKFTPQGGSVTFRVSRAPGGTKFRSDTLHHSEGVLQLSVSDTGIGIPADKLSHVFEAFKQADGSTSRKYGGTGLGLSISRQLAGLLGGEIQLESQLGAGSTFSIYLPAAFAVAPPQNGHAPAEVVQTRQYVTNSVILSNSIPITPDEQIAEALRNKVVVMADDDERNQISMQMILDGYGVTLLTASTGVEVMDILHERNDVDMVLMDIMMPEMDGYETMRKMRQEKRYHTTPIIALTARAMRSDMENCLAAGASDYLSKPIDVQRLLSLMRVWLTDARKKNVETIV